MEQFDPSLTDGARLMVHRASACYRDDMRLLSTPTISAAFGSRCGTGPIAVAQAVLGRSPKDIVAIERRADVANSLNRLILITPNGSDADIRDRAGDPVRANVIVGIESPAPAMAAIGAGFDSQMGA